MNYKLLFAFVFLQLNVALISAATDKILCYYATWAYGRPGKGKFLPEDIDANLCTHVNYAFLGLNDDGSLKVLDPAFDIDQKGLERTAALKKKNPNLKVIFSVGGWAAGTTVFTNVASDAAKRANMAKSAIEFMQKYNFDGVDVDWEYPMGNQKQIFVDLLTTLKEAFKAHNYILTIAVSAIPTDAGYDAKALSNVLDVINVMTYDFHGSWAGITAQNSPLYGSHMEGQWQKDNLNCNSSITHWILSGADPSKLAIGVAFYGRSFFLTDPANDHGLGAKSSGAGDKGPYTQNVGTLGYNEICEFHSKGTVEFDDEQKNPYLYDDKWWIGYDNEKSVKLKAQYAIDKKLAGVMIWSIETDDMGSFCGTKNGLLKALNEVIKH